MTLAIFYCLGCQVPRAQAPTSGVTVCPGGRHDENTVTVACSWCGTTHEASDVPDALAIPLVMAGALVVLENRITEGEAEAFSHRLDLLDDDTDLVGLIERDV